MHSMKSAAAVAVLVTLAGCSSGPVRCPEPGAYVHARAVEPYQVPEGMVRPADSGRVRIPQPSDRVAPELRGNQWEAEDGTLRCLDTPPPPRRELRGA